MLPMTRRRTPGFPHRIALLTAAICLVLAFTLDQTPDTDKLHSHAHSDSHIESGDDSVTATAQARERATQPNGKARSSTVRLSPWFSGLSH